MGFSAGPNSTVTPSMEALEALAELATQERKRVAAGADEEPELNIVTTKASVSSVQSPRVTRVDAAGVEDGHRDLGTNKLGRLSPAAPARSSSTQSSPVVERGASLRMSSVAERARSGKSASPVHERGGHSAVASPMRRRRPRPEAKCTTTWHIQAAWMAMLVARFHPRTDCQKYARNIARPWPAHSSVLVFTSSRSPHSLRLLPSRQRATPKWIGVFRDSIGIATRPTRSHDPTPTVSSNRR